MLGKLVEDPLGMGSAVAIVAGWPDFVVKDATQSSRNLAGKPIGLHDVEAEPFALMDNSQMSYGTAYLNFEVLAKDKVSKAIPCYYLPWGANQVYRMSLQKVSDKVALFFTAPLDGCAVIVEGTAEAPIVYHANASSVEPDVSPLGDPEVLEGPALKLLDKRNEAMFSAYFGYPGGGLDAFSNAKSAGAVTPLEYGVLIGRPSEQDEKRVLRKNLDLEGWFSRTGWKQKPVDLTFYTSTGAVFGVRKGGRWTFYVQKIVTLNEGAFVLTCREFWPAGFCRPVA